MLTHHTKPRMQKIGVSIEQEYAVLPYEKESFFKIRASFSYQISQEKEILDDGNSPSLVSLCWKIYIVCDDESIVTVCHSI